MLRSSLVWLAIALTVSLLGAFEGSHLMASLNDPTPGLLDALHAHADPAPAHTAAPARRVVVVLLDGLGGEALDARLREGTLGEVRWSASLDSGVPSRSRPVYHAMLTGVPQWAAGIRGNGFTKGRADSVPDQVRAGGGKVAWMLQSVPWYCELFCGAGDITVEGSQVLSSATFERVWDAAPDLLVLHLTDVDEAGHLYGAGSEEYLAASRSVMATVAAFRAIARGRRGGDRTIWLIGADHGHTAYGGHGGPEETVRRVSWVALDDGDADVDSGAGAVRSMTPVTALAPTIARALGVDAPRESMEDGLPLFPSVFGAPLRASAARIQAVEDARVMAHSRPLGSASSRAVFIVGGLAATLVSLVGIRRRQGLAEGAVFVVAVAGFLVVGPGLSMSASRTENWYLARGLVTIFVFATAAWAVARRWASPHVVAAACAVFPVLALSAMRWSLGGSDVTPLESVLWPSLGLVPPSVCAAIAVVEILVALQRGMAIGSC